MAVESPVSGLCAEGLAEIKQPEADNDSWGSALP